MGGISIIDANTMMQKYETYKYVTWGVVGLAVLAVPVFFAVSAGQAEPYIPPPSGNWGFFGIVLIGTVGVGGLLANRLVENQHWKAVGREAGLAPASGEPPRGTLSYDDDALIGKSILSGTVRGRPVRARVYTRTQDSQHGSNREENVTLTVVETDLKEASDDGVIINPAHGGLTDTIEGTPTAHDDQFAALASVEAHAQALLAGDAREALRSMDDFTLLFVGNAEKVYEEALPDYGEKVPDIAGFSVGSMIQDGMESLLSGLVIEGDSQTVTHRMEGALLNPAELTRQVEAVVTVAEVFEEARTGARTP